MGIARPDEGIAGEGLGIAFPASGKAGEIKGIAIPKEGKPIPAWMRSAKKSRKSLHLPVLRVPFTR